MIQRLIHPFVFRQKFNSKYYSKLKFSEIFNSKKYSKLYFQKYSIQKNIQNFIYQKYSIQKNIHFRISEEIQFKNIIQNWIFSCIQFKEIFIQYKKGVPPRATLSFVEINFFLDPFKLTLGLMRDTHCVLVSTNLIFGKFKFLMMAMFSGLKMCIV